MPSGRTVLLLLCLCGARLVGGKPGGEGADKPSLRPRWRLRRPRHRDSPRSVAGSPAAAHGAAHDRRRRRQSLWLSAPDGRHRGADGALPRAALCRGSTRYIEAFQADFEQDFRKEHWLADAVEGFRTADPGVGPLLDEWARDASTSFAQLARGVYLTALGWDRRGGKFAADTTREQFVAMEAFHRQARQALESISAPKPTRRGSELAASR